MDDDRDRAAARTLRGARAIAEYLFQNAEMRRTVYNLAAKSRLPVFRLGGILCARTSTLDQYIASQENRHRFKSGKDR